MASAVLDGPKYTYEQLNYFRMTHIVHNIVPEGLRMVFKREWDSLYSATARGRWKDTPQNGKDFLSLESRRSRTRNANLQAKIQNGNTKEWDSSTLFFALLDSVSIGTTLKPLVRKDVYDLRCIRNELVHLSKAELTDVEFQNIVSKVSAAFSSLALPLVYVIEGVRNQTTFKTDEVDEPRREVDALKQIYQERVPEAFAALEQDESVTVTASSSQGKIYRF